MEVFNADFEARLAAALTAVRDDGAAFIPEALDKTFCRLLCRELEEHGQFAPAATVIGKVRQNFEQYRIAHPAHFWLADRLATELAAAVQRQGAVAEPYATWQPNDLLAQRYHPGRPCIDPHRDFASDQVLTVVATVGGWAPFRWLADREELQVLAQWETGPGSLVCLRASGWGVELPMHDVLPPRSYRRVSLGIRHSLTPDGPA